jgi:hypothetical protein
MSAEEEAQKAEAQKEQMRILQEKSNQRKQQLSGQPLQQRITFQSLPQEAFILNQLARLRKEVDLLQQLPRPTETMFDQAEIMKLLAEVKEALNRPHQQEGGRRRTRRKTNIKR